MRRRLARPTNPDALGRLLAALRVYSGQREPKNATERKINQALKAQRLSPRVAKRMLKTLDSMPKSARTRFLGKISAPTFAPPARAPRVAAGSSAPITITIPGTMVGALGRVLDSGAVGEVRDRLGEGPRAQPVEPVYTINYRGLWCEDETSWDQGSWADEIYLITSAVHIDADGNNIVRTEHHPVTQNKSWYTDVDSDEARLGPVAACWQGNSDPVSVTVVMFEHDQGDPNEYKKQIDALVKVAIAVFSYFYPPAKWLELLSGTIADAINWVIDTGDDPIGTQTVVTPRGLLEFYAGQYRATYLGDGQRPTGLEYHFLTTHKGGGARYIVGFEVTRDPPIKIEGPFL